MPCSSERINITVYGMPAPQGSKRFVGIKAGRGILVESSKAVKPWREAVKYAALEIMQSRPGPLDGPLEVSFAFTLPKPKSAPKTRRTFPDRKPDLSKLIRSTEDALRDAGVYTDDARIVRCVARKSYPNESTTALPSPGARISVRQLLETDNL